MAGELFVFVQYVVEIVLRATLQCSATACVSGGLKDTFQTGLALFLTESNFPACETAVAFCLKGDSSSGSAAVTVSKLLVLHFCQL